MVSRLFLFLQATNIMTKVTYLLHSFLYALFSFLPISVMSQTTTLAVGQGVQLCIPEPEYPYTGYGTVIWDSSDAPNMGFTNIPTGQLCAVVGVNSSFSGVQYIRATYTYSRVSRRGGTVASPLLTKTWAFRCSSSDNIEVHIMPEELELNQGDTYNLMAWFSSTGTWLTINWSSSNEAVAKLAYQGDSLSSKLTAVGPGQCLVKVKTTLTSGVSGTATCFVTVKGVMPEAVSISGANSVKVGESIHLSATFTPTNASSNVAWWTDDDDIVSVSSDKGTVTGLKPGIAQVAVTTENNKTDTFEITVEKGDLTLEADVESGLISKGTSVTLTASADDAEIYYTLDGSIPTARSSHYDGPVAILKSCVLKAVAMGENYNSSDILVREYQTTSLEMISKEPSSGYVDRHGIVAIKYNQPIYPGQNINKMFLEETSVGIVPGKTIVQDNMLFYIPNEDLNLCGNYHFSLPVGAVTTALGEVNWEKNFQFKVKGSLDIESIDFHGNRRYIVTADKSLWMYASASFTKVMEDVKQVKCEWKNVYVIKNDGTLWAWGDNEYGQLGDGTTINRETPVKIMEHVAKIAVSEYHALAIKTDGSLWAWGRNGDGQLGDGTYTNRYAPVRIMSGVSEISAGYDHSLAITNDGTLYGWGDNSSNQVKIRPTIFDPYVSKYNSPEKIEGGVKKVAAGLNYSLCIKSNGELRAWGTNTYGALGIGSTNSGSFGPHHVMNGVSQVDVGSMSSAAITTEGSLYTWGENDRGQLGDGTKTNRNAPVKILNDVSQVSINSFFSGALLTDGSLWAWSNTKPDVLLESPQNIKKVTQVSLDRDTLNLPVGSVGYIHYILSPSDAEYKKIVFSSNNEKVATVSSKGVINAKEPGTAVVMVTIDDSFTKKCVLNVKKVYNVEIQKTEHGFVSSNLLSASEGENVTISIQPDEGYTFAGLSITEKNGIVVDYKLDGLVATFTMPANDVLVSASFSPIITITVKDCAREYGEDNPVFEYEVTGGEILEKPTFRCEATKESDTGNYEISVDRSNLGDNIVTMSGTLTIEKAPLTVTAADCTRMEGEDNPEFVITYEGWKNGEDENVLAVKPTAITTATVDSPVGTYDIIVSGGEAKNYAFGYVNGTLTVTEKMVEPTSISLPSTQTVEVGTTVVLQPVLLPENSTTTLTWSSDDESIATVNEGVVTGIKKGETFINVETSNGKVGWCKIVVVNPKPISIVLPKNETLFVNESKTLVPVFTPYNAEDTLTWKSDDERIAKVNADGVVVGVAEGLTVITLTAANGISSNPCKVTVTPNPSGINDVMSDISVGSPVFSLSGQRLAAPRKGINVIGGRKVVVK